MGGRIQGVVSDLRKLSAEAKAHFVGLSAEQLNWKPVADSWSVAQCFDHLITTHSLYFSIFEDLGRGQHAPTFWEKISPFSGFWGKYFIHSLGPENPKKMKTSTNALPSASEIDGRIIERYCEHQHRLIQHLQWIPSELDLEKTIITSPLLGLVTYSIDDCITFLALHGWRHFGQAKRVMEEKGFPK